MFSQRRGTNASFVFEEEVARNYLKICSPPQSLPVSSLPSWQLLELAEVQAVVYSTFKPMIGRGGREAWKLRDLTPAAGICEVRA